MKFAICAGHGDSDPGACYSGLTERDLMTQLRDKVAAKLKALGHQVLTDGGNAVNQPLRDAIKLAKQCDVAVEFHTNAAVTEKAEGVEALSLDKRKELSQALCSTVSSVLLSPMRGDKGWKPQSASARGRLGFVDAGGIILEVFFMSSPRELRKYLGSVDLLADKIALTLAEQPC